MQFSTIVVLAAAFLGTASAAPLERRSFSGDATFYEVGLGACGVYNTDAELIAAAPIAMGKAVCGKTATVSRGGKSVTVKLMDLCQGCAAGSIDLSPAAFNQIASPAEGRVPVTWTMS